MPSGTHSIRLFSALSSYPTHSPKVGELRRRSTATSKTAPAVTRTGSPAGRATGNAIRARRRAPTGCGCPVRIRYPDRSRGMFRVPGFHEETRIVPENARFDQLHAFDLRIQTFTAYSPVTLPAACRVNRPPRSGGFIEHRPCRAKEAQNAPAATGSSRLIPNATTPRGETRTSAHNGRAGIRTKHDPEHCADYGPQRTYPGNRWHEFIGTRLCDRLAINHEVLSFDNLHPQVHGVRAQNDPDRNVVGDVADYEALPVPCGILRRP